MDNVFAINMVYTVIGLFIGWAMLRIFDLLAGVHFRKGAMVGIRDNPIAYSMYLSARILAVFWFVSTMLSK